MTRSFSPEPLPDEIVDQVAKTVLTAPTAGFSQGVDVLVLTSPESRATFWELSSSAEWRKEERSLPLLSAPAIIVPVASPAAYVDRYAESDKSHSNLSGVDADHWPVPYWLVDSSFAVMLMLLKAADLDLGALFFRLHGPDHVVLAGLGVPGDRAAIGAIALGYKGSLERTGSPTRRQKRDVTDAVHHNGW